MNGLSFYDYAQYCNFSNLTVDPDASVSILSGTLDSLKTRQLADALRLDVNVSAYGLKTISFDVILPSSAPNVFDYSYTSKLNGVGMFALLGIVPISSPASVGGTVYPNLPALISRLYGYEDAYNTSGTAVYDTGNVYFGNFGSQSSSLAGANHAISNAWDDWKQGSIGSIVPLSDQEDRVSGTGNIYYNDQPWGISPAYTGGGLKAFKVQLRFFANATGHYIFDVGRLWIGNRFSPLNGVSNVGLGFADQSNVSISRDYQTYPQYFNKARSLSFDFPALYDIEAIGVGQHYSNSGSSYDDVCTVNCVQWAMTYLGMSRECIAAAGRRPGNDSVSESSKAYRLAVYGRPTQWRPLSMVQARKNPKIVTMSPGQRPDNVWTCGLTVQEER